MLVWQCIITGHVNTSVMAKGSAVQIKTPDIQWD